MTEPVSGFRLRRRPQLDGVRGVAIALVVAGHAQLVPGVAGPIGVTVFFALSGFLITTLLLEERGRTGTISLPAFYARRARRLFPALGAYLLAGVLLTPTPLVEFLGPIFYVENWLMALRGSAPQFTSITWSLAIEEQFYLVWPLLVIMLTRGASRTTLVVVAGVGTILAPVLRLLLWDGGDAQWRVYYGTDTRMDCLLIGCLLGILVTSQGVRDWQRHLGLLGVALLVVPFLGGASTTLWLPAVVALGTVLVIVATLSGACRWLALRPMRWLGQRSYALYLWHYPVVYVIARQQHAIPMWTAIVISLALAELSWWGVERPFTRRRPAEVQPERVAVRTDVPASGPER